MNTLNKTEQFLEWYKKLKDPIGKAGIAMRLSRAENGHFGDHKLLPNTGGIYEMRIFKGNGYRLYYSQQQDTIYLLLIGGDKDNQSKDIEKAKQLWQSIQEQNDDQSSD